MNTLAVTVTVLGGAALAYGDFVTLNDAERSVVIHTMAEDDGGAMSADVDEIDDGFVLFDHFIQASTPLAGAAAFGTASQTSDMLVSDDSFNVEASGLAFSSVAVNLPGALDLTNTANSESSSSFFLDFAFDTNAIIDIDGVLSVDLSGLAGDSAEASVVLFNVDTDTVVFSESISVDGNGAGNSTADIDVDGLAVAAGNYELTIFAESVAGSSISGVDDDVVFAIGSAEATYDINLRAIPAPGSLALLSLGGMLAARRRR